MNLRESGYPGIILFAFVLVVMILISLVAVVMSGNVESEDRFSSALGMGHAEEGDHVDGHHHGEGQGFFGFAIEGNLIGYLAIITALLLVSAWLLWRGDREGTQ